MSQIWTDFHQTLHESARLLGSAAVDLYQTFSDYPNAVSSAEKKYYSAVATQLSHYAVIQSMALLFLDETYKHGYIDDLDIIHCNNRCIEQQPTLETTRKGVSVKPFDFKRVALHILENSKNMHGEVINGQTGETLFPEEKMPVFYTAQQLVTISYKNVEQYHMPAIEHLSVFKTAYSIHYDLKTEENNAAVTKMFYDELDIVKLFFETNNFARQKDNLKFTANENVEKLAIWAENQYIPSAFPGFFRYN